MVEQDQPHRLRCCMPARTSSRWLVCAHGLFAALLSACTPLTGVQMSEQTTAPEARVTATDASTRTQPRSERDAGNVARGRDDSAARAGSGGAVGAAGPADAGLAGQAGDTSMKPDLAAAGSGGNAAAGSGGSGTSELIDVTCVPVFVQEARGQFVQVRCQSPMLLGGDRVEYLALPTTALGATCTRFSELASAALLRAAPIGVRVHAAGRGNDSGCETARCRTIRAFSQGM
jgi:hypothetical protein